MQQPVRVTVGALVALTCGALLAFFLADNARFMRGAQRVTATVEDSAVDRRASSDITVRLPVELGGTRETVTALAFAPAPGEQVAVLVNRSVPNQQVRFPGMRGIGTLVACCLLFIVPGLLQVWVGLTRASQRR
jgi:hypothetical protein